MNTASIFKQFTTIGLKQTTLRSVIFALGHFVVDIAVISLVTDATSTQATLADSLSPMLNTIWYWILDYFCTNLYKKTKGEK